MRTVLRISSRKWRVLDEQGNELGIIVYATSRDIWKWWEKLRRGYDVPIEGTEYYVKMAAGLDDKTLLAITPSRFFDKKERKEDDRRRALNARRTS